jgi:hypothetical protein
VKIHKSIFQRHVEISVNLNELLSTLLRAESGENGYCLPLLTVIDKRVMEGGTVLEELCSWTGNHVLAASLFLIKRLLSGASL